MQWHQGSAYCICYAPVCSKLYLHADLTSRLIHKIPFKSSFVRPAVLCLRTEPLCPAALWLSGKLKSSSWVELVAVKREQAGNGLRYAGNVQRYTTKVSNSALESIIVSMETWDKQLLFSMIMPSAVEERRDRKRKQLMSRHARACYCLTHQDTKGAGCKTHKKNENQLSIKALATFFWWLNKAYKSQHDKQNKKHVVQKGKKKKQRVVYSYICLFIHPLRLLRLQVTRPTFCSCQDICSLFFSPGCCVTSRFV